ncbi:hypothetical protein [uncultured Sphingomonas sp.]|uniref:hypothetical protein n=1 Tax=uncultured Sphingomonas sp. TaxID=158754 RepID=UPI0025CD9959|nr:hypothetical protein [uncultured Sphingomonas sp.]
MPYRILVTLTDKGIQFTNQACDEYDFHRVFDQVVKENPIEDRLTKMKNSWTNGRVERVNRKTREATVKRYDYDSHGQLGRRLDNFVAACNSGRSLETPRRPTPSEAVYKAWQYEPAPLTSKAYHQMPGSNT